MTFLGWLSDLLERLSDLQPRDKKVTLNHLVPIYSFFGLPAVSLRDLYTVSRTGNQKTVNTKTGVHNRASKNSGKLGESAKNNWCENGWAEDSRVHPTIKFLKVISLIFLGINISIFRGFGVQELTYPPEKCWLEDVFFFLKWALFQAAFVNFRGGNSKRFLGSFC